MSWRPVSVTHRSHGVSRAARWLLPASVLSFFCVDDILQNSVSPCLGLASVHLATHFRHGVHVPDVNTAAHTLCRMALRSSAASGSPTLQFFCVPLFSFPHLRAPSREGATSLPSLAEFERVVLVIEVEAFCALFDVSPLVCVCPASRGRG